MPEKVIRFKIYERTMAVRILWVYNRYENEACLELSEA